MQIDRPISPLMGEFQRLLGAGPRIPDRNLRPQKAHSLFHLADLMRWPPVPHDKKVPARPLALATPGPANRGPVLRNNELNPKLITKAVQFLHQLSSHPIGSQVPFDLDGRRYVARLEMHGAKPSLPRPHRGITLYHAT